MPEINLLQGNVRASSTGSGAKVLLNVLGVCLLVAAAVSGWLFYQQAEKVQAQAGSTVAEEASVNQSVSNDKSYKTFIATQTTLSALTQLFASHLGWTSLIPNFSSTILKTASLSSFQATANGGMDVSGTVPNFNDLDKMMQGFQLQSFSSFISSVSLQDIGLQHSSAGNRVAFTIHVQFNPDTLKYQSQ